MNGREMEIERELSKLAKERGILLKERQVLKEQKEKVDRFIWFKCNSMEILTPVFEDMVGVSATCLGEALERERERYHLYRITSNCRPDLPDGSHEYEYCGDDYR